MRIAAAALVIVLILTPSTADAWGFEAHKFIVSRAIDILPAAIQPFFEANRASIVERAIDPDLWRSAGFTEEPPNHFLDLDAYGKYPFTDLPREYDDAVKKHGPAKLRQYGLVPWRTHEMAGRLLRGFEALHSNGAYARSDIRFFSSIVGHYVADAHVPLHSVLNYNGQLTGQTGLHYRWEDELFDRYRDQLVLKPGPVRRIQHERDYIFETLLESSQLVPALLAADKEAIGDRSVYDDQYFEALWVRTRPVIEQRLSQSITGVASMIATAWELAGKPALSAAPPPRTPQRRRTAPATTDP